jgi:hypothetical protein
MKYFSRFKSVTIVVALFLFVAPHNIPKAQQASNVDVNLVLAIDCSYSVDGQEYALQMAGMAAAFINPAIIRAIENGAYGAIAVTVVQWSHPDSQIIVVPWMRVSSGTEAFQLAGAIARTSRQTSEGATSISGMLKFGQRLIQNSPFSATRNIIDVVADGENNNGERVERVRDRLNANGITINGLAIQNEVSYLYYYMRNRVIGGNFAFVEQAANYHDFGRAIHRKLLREIQNVPIS